MRKFIFAVLLAVTMLGVTTPVFAADTPTADIRVETVPGQTFDTIVEKRAESSWTWYITRASGIVAGISLVMLLLSGIGSVTGHFFRVLEPLTAWATHRAVGIVCGVSILVHMITLLFDKFVPFSLTEILVPWASNFKPVTLLGISLGSLFVALGVIAFYGMIIIVLTSYLWVDKKPRRWKIYHYVAYIIVIAVFVHGLFLGTDTSSGIGIIAWVIGGVLIAIAILVRLRRAGSL